MNKTLNKFAFKFAFISVLTILASCGSKKQSAQTSPIGEYVYVDYWNTIHVDRNCISNQAKYAKTKEERMIAREGVEFIDTSHLTMYNPGGHYKYAFCPKCIDDVCFKHLSAIMHRNMSD